MWRIDRPQAIYACRIPGNATDNAREILCWGRVRRTDLGGKADYGHHCTVAPVISFLPKCDSERNTSNTHLVAIRVAQRTQHCLWGTVCCVLRAGRNGKRKFNMSGYMYAKRFA